MANGNPTYGQILASNMAATGGVPAQLAMGRDKISMAKAAQDYNLQQQQLSQAIQLQQMRDAIQREQMAQSASQLDQRMGMQQDQFGQQMAFDRERMGFDRDKMAMQQARADQEMAFRQAQEDRAVQEFEAEQAALEQEALEQQQLADFYASSEEEYAQTPKGQALQQNYLDGKIGANALVSEWQRDVEAFIEQKQALARAGGEGVQDRAVAGLMQAAEAAGEPITYEQGLYDYQTGLRTNTKMLADGTIVPRAGAEETTERLEEAGGYGKEKGKRRAMTADQMRLNIPKDKFAVNELVAKSNVVKSTINRAREIMEEQSQLGNFALANMPLTTQKELNNLFDTIRTNVAFDELQSMRESSKTGGAVGQLTDDERKALGQTKGYLGLDQREVANLATLDNIEGEVDAFVSNRIDLFQNTYGVPYNADITNYQYVPMGKRQVAPSGGGLSLPDDIIEIMKRHGGQ